MAYEMNALIWLLFVMYGFSFVTGSAVVNNVDCASNEILMDYALIHSSNLLNNQLYGVNSQCYKCSRSIILGNVTECSNVWTPHSWTLYLVSADGTTAASKSFVFGEQGKYEINAIEKSGIISIEVIETRAPVDSLAPLWVMLGIFTFIGILAFGGASMITYIKHAIWGIDETTRLSMQGGYTAVPLLQPDAGVDESVNKRRDDEESGRRSNTSSRHSLTNINAAAECNSRHSGHSLASINAADTSSRHSASSIVAAVAEATVTSPVSAPAPPKKPARVNSLDTFRGISLCLMIFVNYGGGGYWFFDHAAWNGLTVADLLFPWFMWMMGVSMALSFSAMKLIIADPALSLSSVANRPLDAGSAPRDAWFKVVKRSLTLFCIGMFLANGYDYKTWRIPGVLQYFSVSYFVTSATVLYWLPTSNDKIRSIRTWERTHVEGEQKWALHPEDRGLFGRYCQMHELPSRILSAYMWEWPFQLFLVFLYLTISLGAQAPGCPRGYQGPGGLSENSEHWECTGGIHRYIDMKIFGYDLIYHSPTCKLLYSCIAYDPEGLLGVLTACTLTYLGLMTGRVLLHFKSHKERIQRWLVWGAVQLFLAGCLCGFSQNEGPIPVNKNLWTTSFCLVTSGFGLIGLSITYVLVDVLKLWTGAPFIYLGMNSILIYTGSELMWKHFPFSYEIYSNPTHANTLPMNVFGVVSWIAVAFYCYRIKFFVKV